ncbi:MAG: hypothetical protein ACOC0J_00150 [Myxococcota bacterium]
MVLDDQDADEKEGARSWTDFDCPDCNANNPVDEPFGDGAELRCFYCGAGFKVKVTEAGKLRFQPE